MKNQKSRTLISYSESFKRMVVKEIESEGLSQEGARRKYGIGGSKTVARWVKQYGKSGMLNKKIVVMQLEDQPKLQLLEAEVKRLKEALVQTQLKLLKTESYLEIACEELGQSVLAFEKKDAGKDWKSP